MRNELSSREKALLKRLRQMGPILKGSLVEMEMTCGTPSCRCHKGGPKHKGYYFSYRTEGKSHTVYVPKGRVAEAKQAHRNWMKLKEIIEELTDLGAKRLRSQGKVAVKKSSR